MSTSPREQQNFFGLFELDDSGTILYSRIEPDGRTDKRGPDVAGRNFFKEIISFENAEELRQRITTFRRSAIQADNFIFTCRTRNSLLPVRVLLARIHERTNGSRIKSVLLHIRKS